MKGSSGRISGPHSQCGMSWKSPGRADSQRLPQQCWRGIKTSGKWPYSHLQELVNTHGKGELSSSFIKLTSLSLEGYLHGSRFDLQSPLAVLADKSPTPCSAFPTFELDKQGAIEYLACCWWRRGARHSDPNPCSHQSLGVSWGSTFTIGFLKSVHRVSEWGAQR